MLNSYIKSVLITIILLWLFQQTAQAQSVASPFDRLGVGIGVSTTGVRVEAATNIHPKINLRGGLSFLPYARKESFSISAEKYREYIDYNPDLDINAKLRFFHIHLLADYTPVTNGWFSITGGFLIGSSAIHADGILTNPTNGRPTIDDLRDAGYLADEIPTITFEDKYVLQPNNYDGGVAAKLQLGNVIKPYLGIGIGKSIPNQLVGVKFDLGVLYQGNPEITSPNIVQGNLNDYIDENAQLKKYKNWLRWYPVMNLSLVFRAL